MRTYDPNSDAKELAWKVKAGIIPKFMIKKEVESNSSIPLYAREEVIKLAEDKLT